jgi:outer membrane protein OmpA-like peptidoglycan-associated protein
MRILVLILCLLPSISFAQTKDYKNYDKAVKYNNEGNTEKAIKFANKALEKNAYWSQPNLLLASIYANNSQIELAVDYLLKVYDETNPEDVKGIEQVAELYYSNGFYNEALFYCEKIIAQDTKQYKFTTKIDRYIENCKFAIKAIKSPIDVNAKNMGDLVNSSMTEYVNTITVDGKKLLFTRKIEANQKRDQEDLFVFDIVNNSASPLPFNTSQNEGAITVSADGTMYVYAACDRVNSIGGCDLYIRQYSKENGWSKEYNLGENVNSNKWESQACFSPDGGYLYFISNRPGGFGKEDIWRSEITKEGFMPAKNLGSSINTNQIEMSPFLHPDNLTLYFASEGHIGMGDDDLFVSRRANSQQQWDIPKNMCYPINTHNSENSLIVASNGKTAYYTSDFSGFGKEDIFQFDLPEHLQAEPLEELELEIITQQVGEEVILKNVSFESNSYALEETSFVELDKLIAYLKKNPNLQIEIQGHTDDVGNEIENQRLSEQRANVVFEYLSPKVNNTLRHKGFGESQPLGDNRKINRRTSFVIIQ